MLINDLYTNKTPAVAEQSLNEFAPGQGGGDSGNYFQALASAWYNGTFDSGSLQKGIKSQEDVERLLQRGIVCPDGVTRKFDIGYNSNFDGVVISSDDYYEHADHDETDSRTGKPFGPYDYMEFGGEELDESAQWRDPKYKDQLYTQEKPDYNDTREYDRARWDPKPKGYPGRKEPMAGGEFPRTDPLVKGFGRYGVGEPVSKGPRKGLPSRDQITSLKGSIKDAHGKHHKPNLPEQGVAEGKDEKIAQLKKDHDTAVHWSKNETSPQKREAARRKAETIKAHLEKQYKQGVAEGTLDEAVGMMIKGAVISGANDQDIADRIAAKTGGRVDSGSYGHHILITYPTTQHRAEAAVKIRKMFPGIELYKSGGNRNAIDEQGMAEGSELRKIAKADVLAKAPKPRNQQEYDFIQKYRKDLEQSYKSYNPKKEQDIQDTWNLKPRRNKGMAEGSGPVTHRIGLTVTDPNHPMVSKRKEPYQKSVRITQDVPDREAAINQAIAHHRRKGYKVHDHHYIGTVDDEPIAEVSLGDYRKKATVNKAVAQTDRFFGRDDPAAVAAADQTIAKREKGLARADARTKPYTPPAQDAEKQQRDLTAKYPNIDQLVADAERNRDPYYDRAEGNAYYRGREAEQLYQKLKQIQRVIQGLNESRQKLDEFNPSPPPEPQAAGGMKFDLMGRPYKPAPVTPNYDKSVADYGDTTINAPTASVPNTKSMMPTNMMPSTATAPVAKSVGTATPVNPYQVTAARTTTPPVTPAAVPSTAMTTTAPELQTIDAPAQLTGPAQAKQPSMANPDITDVVARAPTAKRAPVANIPALPAPAAPTTPNYGSGVTNATMNAPTASVPDTKSMMPANMMPRTATAPPKPAVSTTAAKNDIVQALKKLGYKSKEAEAAIRGLPPNISTSDAIRQILRGKPTTTESLTWSRNFDPGRSLYNRMKQDR